MRFRQIHLDFHTSGRIPDIGSKFDPKAFGKAFKDAYVDSVTVFSKCHHGYSYHPTKVGEMHPHLEFDLLRGQLDALHAENINAPIYLTATWDELAAFNHPEWRTVAPDGSLPRFMSEPNGAGWASLDFSTPYLDYLCNQVEEVMENYPDGDGIFMDISWQLPSISASAQAQMEKQGLDWTDPDDRAKFTIQSSENFFQRVQDAVVKHNPKTPLFFNSGHIRKGMRQHYHQHYTHLELESLPTAGWGYEHFPLSARYVEQMDMPFLGMTGKFHYHWGEVGGYKKPDAMIYECGAMIAQGARCSIGDHLHPTAAIDNSTMRVIAPAYKWVAEREAWAEGSTNRAEIGLVSVEAMSRNTLSDRPNKTYAADEGAVRILMEGQFTFDVLDRESDLSGYRLIILPDEISLDDAYRAKLRTYADAGGKVLTTGASGIDADTGFLFDVGATWQGVSEMAGGDYLLPTPDWRADGIDEPLFMYQPAQLISVKDGETLGDVYFPYFDRTPRHFSGHVNAPSCPDASGFAAGVRKGNFTHIAHPIFSCYRQAGAVSMLEIAEKAIRSALGGDKAVTTSLPRAGRVTVRNQAKQNRDVVHLLHATPALRGNLRGSNIQPIQDLVTLHDIAVSMHVDGKVAEVKIVPDNTVLAHDLKGDILSFKVPEVRGHQMIEISYS
ncbi:beta-galactosidase trimerization domain-containing protein [Devosia algicola]|uniref:Beta-galactosidase trimerization domain-containing protein n=1 Tax=Devosia algicola TaxID=3026418 RepID=A0ABY7YMP5_9HYPH|nr:alpha-amylase family protein [Devosia algicola]WDR02573.1 beta-galactosidase trimerization domain-containing protein [Devosia algicola]